MFRGDMDTWTQNENALLIAINPQPQFPAAPQIYSEQKKSEANSPLMTGGGLTDLTSKSVLGYVTCVMGDMGCKAGL